MDADARTNSQPSRTPVNVLWLLTADGARPVEIVVNGRVVASGPEITQEMTLDENVAPAAAVAAQGVARMVGLVFGDRIVVFFGGLSIEETAEALGISPATVKRDWTAAKTWLHHELNTR